MFFKNRRCISNKFVVVIIAITESTWLALGPDAEHVASKVRCLRSATVGEGHERPSRKILKCLLGGQIFFGWSIIIAIIILFIFFKYLLLR